MRTQNVLDRPGEVLRLGNQLFLLDCCADAPEQVQS